MQSCEKNALEGSQLCEKESKRDGKEVGEDDDPCCSLSPSEGKQILVEHLSLNQLEELEDHPLSVPDVFTEVVMHSPTLPPLRTPKFISSSLPCSTVSSPQCSSAMMRSFKQWDDPPPLAQPSLDSLALKHSAALSRFALEQAVSLSSSKSCRDGRSYAPADDFDFLPRKPSIYRSGTGGGSHSTNGSPKKIHEEKFKCGALCLHLPSFSKKKPIQVTTNKSEHGIRASSVSTAISLEKFECGLWSSDILRDNVETDEARRSYFDMPSELTKSRMSSTDSPVKTAFIFDNDRKGVLKKSPSYKSPELSNRRVRFSTSSPLSYPSSPSSACISPTLRKAREEFNAFLEAQSA
ncbi:uncharacterized protein [Typha angustifolia]|uniref:uncharacterized protein n=1 Tax=Typha angustifolia TaxID=59011 RepID=UPI003C302503